MILFVIGVILGFILGVYLTVNYATGIKIWLNKKW